MTAQLEDSPIPQPIFTTSRLIIRHMHPQDAPSSFLNINSKAVAKYMSLAFPDPPTLESTNSWIALNVARPIQTDFVICEKSSPGDVIGGMGLKLGADVMSHTAEMGFWVGEKHWGKGYVTEALAGLTKYCFESWEGQNGQRLTRLWGFVFDGNVGSMRCFEKCGYAKEGVMKGHAEKRGVVYDTHLYGITKADWEARQ
jgi:ribosomal-protein-alanine N-acetyltransferase